MNLQKDIPIPVHDNDINKDWIAKVLQKYYCDPSVKVKDAIVEPFADYTGFMSRMVKAKVDFQTRKEDHHIELFIKLLPEKSLFQDLVSLRVDVVEFKFYTEIVPRINKIVDERVSNLEDRQALKFNIPTFIHASYTVDPILSVFVFEDFSSQGFEKPKSMFKDSVKKDRFLQIIDEIAKINAIGFALNKYDRENLESYSPMNSLLSNKEEIKKIIDQFEPMLEPLEGKLKEIADKHSVLSDKGAFVSWVMEQQARDNELNINPGVKLGDECAFFNHGDCHFANVTFSPKKLCLYDWQAVNIGPPGKDLGSLFSSAVDHKDMEEFLMMLKPEWEQRLSRYAAMLGVQDFLAVLSTDDFNCKWKENFICQASRIAAGVAILPMEEDQEIELLRRMEFLYSKRGQFC